jgi:hypothetical protein
MTNMTEWREPFTWAGKSDNWELVPQWEQADMSAILLEWPENHPFGDKSAFWHEIVVYRAEWAYYTFVAQLDEPDDAIHFITKDGLRAYAIFYPDATSWAISVLTV